MNTFKWKEIVAGTPVTRLRTGRVGTEEMIPGCLILFLGWGAGAGPQGDFRQGRRKQTWKGRRKEEMSCQVL